MSDDKQIDAVQLMREIREHLNRELAGKTYEQQKRYIQERVPPPPVRQRSSAA
jgi:hypothetical protein